MALKSIATLLSFQKKKELVKKLTKENSLLKKGFFELKMLFDEVLFETYIVKIQNMKFELEADNDGDEITQILFNADFYVNKLYKDVKKYLPELISQGDNENPDLFLGLEVNTLSSVEYGDLFLASKANMDEYIKTKKLDMINNSTISKQLTDDI